MLTTHKYRPVGFQDVNIYLVVQVGKADALIAFLKKAFAAQVREEVRDQSGRLAHGELLVGDSVIEIGEGNEWQSRVSLHFFVPDVDATHASALAAGAKELGSPVDHEYGERSSAIEDPAGNRWYIAKALEGRV